MTEAVVLTSVMGALLVTGLVLTAWWGGRSYVPWVPADPTARPARTAGLTYVRGVAVALVGGFWAGALVTGSAMRLTMRLLAVTAGPDAQGRRTEAEEVVGEIDLGGTIGLQIFGGILPGLLSGALYVLVRRWLPGGRLGGVVFGLLHLVVAATRVEPLRADNPDFGIVGPGWLAALTFGLASVVHGMAVVAIANRASAAIPPRAASRTRRVRAWSPLVPPVLLLIPGFFLFVPLAIGLAIAVLASRMDGIRGAAKSRTAITGGRLAFGALALVALPGTVAAVAEVVRSG